MNYRQRLDPLLVDLLGDEPAEQSLGPETDADDELDPVGAMIHEQIYGIRPPAPSEKTPLTVGQIAKALTTLREEIGNAAFTRRFGDDMPKLLEGARAYCEPTDFAREFIEGFVAKDDSRMRAAVKKFVSENREELLN
jgi:hypothetical protein